MFLTTHAAAGILISHYVPGAWPVFGASFASHFVLDFIPHGDEELYHDREWMILKKYKRVVVINAIDLTGLLALTLWAVNSGGTVSGNLMVIGVLGSVLPDLISFFFPVIHQRFSWLFVMRWLYTLTKPTGIRYVARSQNWVHNVLHHRIIHKDIPFKVGLVLQAILVTVMLGLSR